jgi:two-component system, cell cycle response regulator DivK
MPKILLVEDNAINRDMLTRRLQRHGFSVCCAHDGAQGVAMAASEMPDLILMDVALGEMDGWEATQLIKANPATSAIPIVALTAHALASDRDKSVEVGCSDFDTKPVDMQRLLGKIRGCLPPANQQSAVAGLSDRGRLRPIVGTSELIAHTCTHRAEPGLPHATKAWKRS